MKKIIKRFLAFTLVIYLIIILLTVSVLGAKGNFSDENTSEENISSDEIPEEETIVESNGAISYVGGDFLIKDVDTGDIITLTEEEFLLGTVCLEMSPLSPTDAIKAQVVAARTYYTYLKETSSQEYAFTYSSLNHTIYEDEEYFIALWGDDYDEYTKYVEDAIEETSGEVLVYEDEVACTVFCAMSNGTTLNSGEVWQEDLPYLSSVASPYDVLSSSYEKTTTFSTDEVKKIVEENFSDGVLNFDLDYDQWFTEIEYGTGSSVISTNICGYTVTGTEVRNAFGLRSTTYDIEYDGTKFIFSTKGYGHGVGMSQTGAIAMANVGATYEEILSWYYLDTEIKVYS